MEGRTDLDGSEDHAEESEEEAGCCEVVVSICGEADSDDDRDQREVGHGRVIAFVAEAIDKHCEDWTGGAHDLVEGDRDHGPG